MLKFQVRLQNPGGKNKVLRTCLNCKFDKSQLNMSCWFRHGVQLAKGTVRTDNERTASVHHKVHLISEG